MSQHIFRTKTRDGKDVIVMLGYDRPLDYVFCNVLNSHEDDSDEDVIYSNLSDDLAGTEQQDVSYFKAILLDLSIRVPESIFEQVRSDQQLRVGNRTVEHDPSHPINKTLDWPDTLWFRMRYVLAKVMNRPRPVRVSPLIEGSLHLLEVIGLEASHQPGYCAAAYQRWEDTTARHLLETLGFSNIQFSTGDCDAFGPVTRVVAASRDGVLRRFVYG